MNRTYPKKWLLGAFAFCLAFWVAVGYSAFAQTAQPGPGAPPQGPYTYYQLQAQKIVAGITSATATPVNTQPPVVTLSGTYTTDPCSGAAWNTPNTLPSSTKVTTFGGLVATGDGTSWGNQIASTNTAALTTGGQSWGQVTNFYGTCFSISYNGYGSGAGPIRIKIDNQYLASTAYTTFTDGYRWIVLTFPTAGFHKIEINFTYADSFAGYGTSSGGLLWAPDEISGTTTSLWFGDSYVAGQNVTDPVGNLASMLAQAMGIRHIIPSGEGGQGWVATGTSYGNTFGQRVTAGDLTRTGSLRLIIMMCSINDHAQTTGTITTNAQAGAIAAFAQHPESLFLFVTGFDGGSSEQNNATANTACVTGFNNAISAAGAANRSVLVNGYSDTPNWVLVAAMTSDNIHPNALGCQYLASRIVQDALPLFRALAGTPLASNAPYVHYAGNEPIFLRRAA